MRNTFDVGRVRALEYMRTYQKYFGILPILIRFKEYVDYMFRCIHSANGVFLKNQDPIHEREHEIDFPEYSLFTLIYL